MGDIILWQTTISSVELVAMINGIREDWQAELMHSDFLKKVSKVLGQDLQDKFLSTYIGENWKKNPCYLLPKREASLMVMSENYKVQAMVYDRMEELENSQFKIPKNLSWALLLASQQAELIEEQTEKIALLERTKGQISSSREASVMWKLSAAKKEIINKDNRIEKQTKLIDALSSSDAMQALEKEMENNLLYKRWRWN